MSDSETPTAAPSPAPATALPPFVSPLPPMVDWTAPGLVALDAVWAAEQPAVRATVTKALHRSLDCRPGSEVDRHEDQGVQKVKRGDGTVWQQSIDETVQWTLERGDWKLMLPYQVVNKLRQLEHQPLIAVARAAREDGNLSEEERIATRLSETAARLKAQHEQGRGLRMFGEPTIRLFRSRASAYRNMPVKGRKGLNDSTGCRHSFYYLWEPLPIGEEQEQSEDLDNQLTWRLRLEAAQAAHDHELAWACQQMLRGKPVRISNFYIEPLYSLKRADGSYLRVLRVHTAARAIPFGPIELEGVDYHSATYLRRLLNGKAGGVWHAGDTELQMVIEDCSLIFDQKEVEEIPVIGWHAPSGAWFTHTSCMDCRGELRVPDRSGVFSVPVPRRDGNGYSFRRYKLSAEDKDGLTFALGKLDWRPDLLLKPEREFTDWEKQRNCRAVDPAEVRQLFADFCRRGHDMVGGWNAYMGIGWVFANLAAPEVFKRQQAFPGYWIHGEVKQGKSTWAIALMKCLGYPCNPTGVSLESSTGAGGETVLQQYNNLPAWFEEAQNTTKETLLTVLKSVFNRQPPTKRVMNLRQVLTSALVVGVTTCGDAQIRSRFPHQLVSSRIRLPRAGDLRETADEAGNAHYTEDLAKIEQDENYDWIKDHWDRFVLFSRLVLERRQEFADGLLETLETWLRSTDTRHLDERAKLVHGVCFASFTMLTRLFGVAELRHRQSFKGGADGETMLHGQTMAATATVVKRFRQAMIDAARVSAADVAEAAELDRFFKIMVTSTALGVFGETKQELGTYFKVTSEAAPVAPGTLPEAAQNQRTEGGRWRRYILLIRSDRVCMAMEQHLRKSGHVMPLREDELRRQMTVKPYWGNGRVSEKQRFGSGAENNVRKFWALNLDEMGPEWGYRAMADDDPELVAWLESAVVPDPWLDPRRSGGCYEIVKRLEAGTQKAE
jgi:hypothetical protein